MDVHDELGDGDPFELRLSFLNTLSSLTATKTAIGAACHQAMVFQRHHAMIFECIKDMTLEEASGQDLAFSFFFLLSSLSSSFFFFSFSVFFFSFFFSFNLSHSFFLFFLPFLRPLIVGLYL